MAQDICRIVVYGETTSSVHGAELREKIQEIALKWKIDGQIRNVKGWPQVEIICCRDDAKTFGKFLIELEGLKSRKDALYKVTGVVEKDALFDDFNGFNVVRGDDLSEMVWGLQAAGKVFSFSEKTRNISLLKSLELCLNSVSVQLDQIEAAGRCSPFHLFAIEHFLEQPPANFEGADTFLVKLWDLYTVGKSLNALMDDKAKPKDMEFVRQTNHLRELLCDVAALIKVLYEKN
jgi:acylphosphatase